VGSPVNGKTVLVELHDGPSSEETADEEHPRRVGRILVQESGHLLVLPDSRGIELGVLVLIVPDDGVLRRVEVVVRLIVHLDDLHYVGHDEANVVVGALALDADVMVDGVESPEPGLVGAVSSDLVQVDELGHGSIFWI